jgi:enterobactin synthetase component D
MIAPSHANGFITHSVQLLTLIQKRLPANVRVSAGKFDCVVYSSQLFKQFNITLPNSIAQSVLKRQSEFLAGRIMAQKSLQQLDHKNVNIAIGKDRSPIWPIGIIGAISHSNDLVLCIMASTTDYAYVGCDIEPMIANDTRMNIDNIIINEDEKLLMKSTYLEESVSFTLVYSAKESLFKALYPDVKRYFDFSAAQISDIDTSKQTFNIKLLETLSPNLLQGHVFHGIYIIYEHNIITFIIQ